MSRVMHPKLIMALVFHRLIMLALNVLVDMLANCSTTRNDDKHLAFANEPPCFLPSVIGNPTLSVKSLRSGQIISLANGKSEVFDSLSDEIREYMPFQLVFMKGSDMFADALSRPPPAICSVWSLEQQHDPLFANVARFKRDKKGSLSPAEQAVHAKSYLC